MKRHARAILLAALGLTTTSCATATIEPGHRGLLFDPGTGLQREVLAPGVHRLHGGQRVDDFSVLVARRDVSVEAVARDGTPVRTVLTVLYRPIVAELYALDTEEGPRYFDEGIGPLAMSAARPVLEQALFDGSDLPHLESVEDALLQAVRSRTAGHHVEIYAVAVQDLRIAGR